MEIEEEIKSIIKNSPVKEDSLHSEITLRWVLKLEPDADEALKIVALSHDIERAVTNKVLRQKYSGTN